MLRRGLTLEPCLPPTGERAAGRGRLDSRDQARRLPDPGAPARAQRAPRHAQRPRPRGPFPPLIAEAIEALPIRSCVVDGEAIVCDDCGLAVFELIRKARRTQPPADLSAMDGYAVRSRRHENPPDLPPRQAPVQMAAWPRLRRSLSAARATSRTRPYVPLSHAAGLVLAYPLPPVHRDQRMIHPGCEREVTHSEPVSRGSFRRRP